MDNFIIVGGALLAFVGTLASLVYVASIAAQSKEQANQAKAETKEAIKQVEKANVQTKIARNAPNNRVDALNRVSATQRRKK